ncbi:MAG: medium chain dehydrogenase/reductase family protein [Pseudomonadota bacterium]
MQFWDAPFLRRQFISNYGKGNLSRENHNIQGSRMSYQRVVITKYGGPEVLELVDELTLPEPGPGEVRIKVEATSANFTDTMIRRRIYPATRRKRPPFSPGYDIAGSVDKLGEGVSEFKLGEVVVDLTVTGGYSEYICLPADRLTRVPDGVDPVDATAMVLSYVTAYQLIHRLAKVKKGGVALVHAAGGAVGTALMELGRLHGLQMFGTASRSKHDLVKQQGAIPIDYTREDFRQVIREAGHPGVDAVFDCTTPKDFNRGFGLLNPGGTFAFYGMQLNHATNLQKALMPVDMARLFARNVFSPNRALKFYSIAKLRDQQPEWFKKDLGALLQMLADGQLRPVIEEKIALKDAQDAHRRLDKGAVKGKLVFAIEPIDCW